MKLYDELRSDFYSCSFRVACSYQIQQGGAVWESEVISVLIAWLFFTSEFLINVYLGEEMRGREE